MKWWFHFLMSRTGYLRLNKTEIWLSSNKKKTWPNNFECCQNIFKGLNRHKLNIFETYEGPVIKDVKTFWKSLKFKCKKFNVYFLWSDSFESKLSSCEFFQKTKIWIHFYCYVIYFHSFFGWNWRHQKEISKLSDL